MRLRQEAGGDGAVDVGEAVVAAAVAIDEALVVETEQVEDGRVEVVVVDGVFDDADAVLVGGAVADAALDAAAGHPHGEPRGVRVAAIVSAGVRGAAERAAPMTNVSSSRPCCSRSAS